MDNPIYDELYKPIQDKLSPLAPYVLIAFIIFLIIFGLIEWFILRKNRKNRFHNKRWRRPLYRIEGRVYWKGIPVDDDEFEAVRMNKRELNEYNYWVKKLNRRNKKRFKRHRTS